MRQSRTTPCARRSMLVALAAAAACTESPTALHDPALAPQMATSAATTTVDVVLRRFDGGSGTVLVSSGIPLMPGTLLPSDTRNVRVLVGGKEQPVHVSALGGTHPNGSVRSILVQLRYAVAPTGTAAQLVLGQSRSTTDLARTALTYTYAKPLPVAVMLPSSPAYLIATGAFGKTVLAPDAFNGTYESNFAKYGDPKWSGFMKQYGSTLTGIAANLYNYYDRALFHYAWWARTGKPEYWKRAAYYLLAYRELYLKPNGYMIQPHDSQIEGLELHYLLTGDTISRYAVQRLADRFYAVWHGAIGDPNNTYMENRIQARVLDSYLTAHRIGVRTRDFATASRQGLTKILATQRSDGSYRFVGLCYHQLNYMAGLLNDVFIKYHDHFEPDTRIAPAIKRSIDFLWSTQWLPASGGFRYLSGLCSAVGSTTAAPDLNLLIANGFGWYAKRSGVSTYRTKGDAIFNEGVKRAWITGEKQYNENYRASFRYLFYRR